MRAQDSAAVRTLRDLGLPWPRGRVEYDVAGKAVLVTGGADGIGFALARLLHTRGAFVALVDSDGGELAAAASALGEQRTVTVTADVRDRAAMTAAVEETVARAGRLDVVVANAGITPPPATLRQIDPAAFNRVLDVNLNGTFNIVHATADEVIARRGHIVVVSSAASFTPGPAGSAYMISKAAVEQLGRALRLELAGHGATVGVAHFGFVDTGLAQNILDDDPVGRRLQSRLPAPLRRRITPERAATVLADGIARRAGVTMAPLAWQPWALFRGLVNILADAYLARDRELALLVRDVEAGIERSSGPVPRAETRSTR